MPDQIIDSEENIIPVEHIPNSHLLFYRIHKNNTYPNGSPMPVAFVERGDDNDRGMSTDWSKYSNPQETKNRSNNPDKSKIGVLSFEVKKVRQISYQEVLHAPQRGNPAHTNIKWNIDRRDKTQKEEIRKKYMKIYRWVINFDN